MDTEHDTSPLSRIDKAAPPNSRESGSALVLGLFFSMVTVGVVLSGSILMSANRKQSSLRFQTDSQAKQFAKSGLTEALSWFRRQTSQPVVDFEPIVDLASDPQVIDTMDDDIGIVREFRISGSTWGRYEVWKELADDPVDGRQEWRDQMDASMLFQSGSQVSDGSEWRIRSIGYVFERRDQEQTEVEGPGQAVAAAARNRGGSAGRAAIDADRIIASHILEGDVVRLRLAPPGQSALCSRRGDAVRVSWGGRIDGGSGSAGVLYPSSTGSMSGSSNVNGTPNVVQSDRASYNDDPQAVFGVPYERLKSVADAFITSMSEFPNSLADGALVVVDVPSVAFNNAFPLRGFGVIYIRGDVTIEPGSQSNFTGLLYVEGNLTINAPAELTGAVVVTGSTTMAGVGDFATINYDDAVLNQLRLELGKYRFAGGARRVDQRSE